MKKRNVTIITIITIAVLALTTVFIGWNLSKNYNVNRDNNEIIINLEKDYNDISTKSVLLEDVSDSVDSVSVAAEGYDITIPFSTYIGQTDGNSHICGAIKSLLDMGIHQIGVMTDLECYPEEDWYSLENSYFENVELKIFVAENATNENINRFRKIIQGCVNSENSTFIFIFSDGNRGILFDNYKVETSEVNRLISVKTENNIPYNNFFYFVIIIMFIIIIAMLIAFICILHALVGVANGVGVKDIPVEIQEALTHKTALDGSSSVSGVYGTMCKWAKDAHVGTVYRFASDIEELSIEEASQKVAGGGTCGWSCMKEMFDKGYREITIVSDFDFNDQEIENLQFNSVTMVVPANCTCNEAVISKIQRFATNYKVIQI